MLEILFRKMSLWWEIKQHKQLEEQYWYQTACLIEERRELRKAQAYRTHRPNIQGA